ncbi:oligoribonuclease [Candidatus Erwinia haradaeae]|uniref:Oligoribonuclease n=1 Tax=Candidatus Erwinia haradaeae TaxID=1922217 RepID=A0A803FTE6_9GAMM|nr:oligoribonuclease [Candidatus Erwinia haradaeae]VFP87949.1 Oligoribonuclease [Candidatus Erwinia haradaeae]
MTENIHHLIWIDLEMTGLNPENDRILEIATLLTDNNLSFIVEGPVLAINQKEKYLRSMDEWNMKTHTNSGLVERVRTSFFNERSAELATIEFLKPRIQPHSSPMCGNSIGQDRRFLRKYMPDLESYFHYRSLDISVLKELASRWRPSILNGFRKNNRHNALYDIYESVAELDYYRQNFIKIASEIEK